MRVVLLGGSGFIGAHLARALLDAGDTVISYDRQPPAHAPRWPGVDYRLGDLYRPDTAELAATLADADLVYHLAWRFLPAESNHQMQADIAANLAGTVRLLETCVAQRVGRVIFFSSGGTVYGPAQAPIPETHPTEPRSSHAVIKLAVEKYLALFDQLHGLDYVILRPGNPFGPYQDPGRGQGVIPAFMAQAAAGLPLDVWGDGRAVRDYFYVGDLAEAARLAGRTTASRAVYNIGSGVGRSLTDVITVLERLFGRSLPVQHHPARGVDAPFNVLDITKARTILGWSPRISFEEGLRRTWAALADPDALAGR
ncbi:MAG: dTDP-4-dehydro-6-deoxyglucose reductase [Chloroflexi bacterium ADurb.Bin325]|nr:MAG: dTDP-4-dehydro-6-deoxyglucose reductase [Chloroflexi bacterium ADurb.Bin325]